MATIDYPNEKAKKILAIRQFAWGIQNEVKDGKWFVACEHLEVLKSQLWDLAAEANNETKTPLSEGSERDGN